MTARPPAPARQRWLVPVLVVVLSVTVGGGLLARELYRRPDIDTGVPSALATPTPVAADDQPGLGTVTVSEDAARHPDVGAVEAVLQDYFDGVNKHDYDIWTRAVTRDRMQDMPEAKFRKDFVSTKDGTILLYRIEPGAGSSLRVLVGFTSTQSLDEAPADLKKPCIHWRLVLPMVFEDGGYKIDTVQGGTGVEHEAC
ncbi:hypothetical protein VSH64_48245 [Amycolatopsis rhabdoformis]|uniref:Uncharacterized protein n=1 Tax=Amycolatopsis rhabdoformis TaxID=1448059 RepID=A0ABZ1IAB1_9PSEU|nr:hypothetical protein [Amycolatopsis rhabdoformis]WSE30499.1 hypothetical protein VSH64_48245 [Amycolatopsis rhabdoformis]